MAPNNDKLQKCGVCSSDFILNEPKINCGGWCEMAIHKHCSDLSRDKVKILLESPSLRWMCKECTNESFRTQMMLQGLKSSIEQLHTAVSNQTEVINKQNNKIREMHAKINGLTSFSPTPHNVGAVTNQELATPPVVTQNKRDKTVNAGEKRKLTLPRASDTVPVALSQINTITDDPLTQILQNKQVQQQSQRNKHQQNRPIPTIGGSTDDDGFILVRAKRQQRHKKGVIEGTNNAGPIKAISRTTWIFVTRLSLETTEEQIIKALADISEVKCEKLELHHSDRWSSFRINAPLHHREAIMNGQIWPEGSQVSKYFFPRKHDLVTEKPKQHNEKHFLSQARINLQDKGSQHLTKKLAQ